MRALLAFITLCSMLAPAGVLAQDVRIPLGEPPQPSGDALWDHYAASVWHRLAAPDAYSGLSNPALLSDAELAGGMQFAEDRRFWELRFWTRLSDAQWRDDRSTSREEMLAAARHLDAAHTWHEVMEGRGIATPASRLRDWDTRLKLDELNLRFADVETLDQVYSRASRAFYVVVEEREYLEQMVADFPDSAWPHYLLALHYEHLHLRERALDELARGNLKPDAALPALFPASHAAALLARDVDPRQPALDTGNLLVALAVMDVERTGRLGWEFDHHREFSGSMENSLLAPEYNLSYPFSELVRAALDRGDIAAASALRTFALRLIQARPNDTRLAALGLGAVAGLIEQSAGRWQWADQPFPAAHLREPWWANLTTNAAGHYSGRSEIYFTFSTAEVRWLHERFAAGARRLPSEWEQNVRPEARLPNEWRSVYDELKVSGAVAEPSRLSLPVSLALLSTYGSALSIEFLETAAMPPALALVEELDMARILPPEIVPTAE
jgi:hypothetical protein